MPDTTIVPQSGGPYDPPLEPRVSRHEENMSDFKATCARIEAMLPHLATSTQMAELRGDLEVALARFTGEFDAKLERFAGAFDAKLERLTGRVEALPTTWQMMTAIIAGQITLAGLLAAALFGAARMFGHT